jgi:hypothetical protein
MSSEDWKSVVLKRNVREPTAASFEHYYLIPYEVGFQLKKAADLMNGHFSHDVQFEFAPSICMLRIAKK